MNRKICLLFAQSKKKSSMLNLHERGEEYIVRSHAWPNQLTSLCVENCQQFFTLSDSSSPLLATLCWRFPSESKHPYCCLGEKNERNGNSNLSISSCWISKVNWLYVHQLEIAVYLKNSQKRLVGHFSLIFVFDCVNLCVWSKLWPTRVAFGLGFYFSQKTKMKELTRELQALMNWAHQHISTKLLIYVIAQFHICTRTLRIFQHSTVCMRFFRVIRVPCGVGLSCGKEKANKVEIEMNNSKKGI